MNAWTFQDRKQLAKLGDKCPWSVGWYDSEGRRKQKRVGSHSLAEKYARKIEGQLAAGVYEGKARKPWAEFRQEYETLGMIGTAASTHEVSRRCLDHFQEIAKPARVSAITSRMVAQYVAARRAVASPATVNKELRHLRAAIRKAHRWGYLPRVPEFDFLREPGKLATYVSPEHFAKLYGAAGDDWWRGVLVTAYMTGWRIGSILALRWADVDLEQGVAISPAADNKGKRDQRVPLHPLVVDHLRRLVSFSPLVFPWADSRRALYTEFATIQAAANVKREDGHAYGFHDFRRAFATMNAPRLTADALQSLMQHKAYTTTEKYINMAQQHNATVPALFVPELPRAVAVG
jgi:integrase